MLTYQEASNLAQIRVIVERMWHDAQVKVVAVDVVTDTVQARFLERLNLTLQQGWSLQGGTTYSAPGHGGQGYIQTIVKYAK